MRCSFAFAVALALCGALPAFAKWTLDTSVTPNILSNGSWTLKVVCNNATKRTYLLGTSKSEVAYVAGSGVLDLTTVKADTGATLVGVNEFGMNNVSALTSIKMPETMTIFGRNCFCKCSNLVSITPFLPGGTTTIATCAFKECTSLTGDLYLTNDAFTVVANQIFEQVPITSVHFSTNLESIGGWAFTGNALTRIYPMEFPKLRGIYGYNLFTIGGDTLRLTSPQLTEICQNAFAHSSFTNLVLSPTITTIGKSAFQGNSNLKSIKLVQMRKKNVPVADASIGFYAFRDCYSLEKVELPFRGPYKLAGFSFQDCYNLTNVTFWGVAPTDIEAYWLTRPRTQPSLDYRIRFACSMNQDAEGWKAHATELTDAEKAKAEYPGVKCFGTVKKTNVPVTWLVKDRSGYDLKGLIVIVEAE